jgi:hypothetical protein
LKEATNYFDIHIRVAVGHCVLFAKINTMLGKSIVRAFVLSTKQEIRLVYSGAIHGTVI